MYHDTNRGDAADAIPAPPPAELKLAADALFGDGFWGRERVNPVTPEGRVAKAPPAAR